MTLHLFLQREALGLDVLFAAAEQVCQRRAEVGVGAKGGQQRFAVIECFVNLFGNIGVVLNRVAKMHRAVGNVACFVLHRHAEDLLLYRRRSNQLTHPEDVEDETLAEQMQQCRCLRIGLGFENRAQQVLAA